MWACSPNGGVGVMFEAWVQEGEGGTPLLGPTLPSLDCVLTASRTQASFPYLFSFRHPLPFLPNNIPTLEA